MPYLADFLGQLAAAITRARLQADMEAVRMAELYSSHDYLRHFPVPHFRLPDVEIKAPMMIQETGEPVPGKPATDMLKQHEILTVAETVFSAYVKRKEIKLNEAQVGTLNKSIAVLLQRLDRVEEIASDVGHISKLISRGLASELSKLPDIDAAMEKVFAKELDLALKIGLLNKQKSLPTIKVIVETAKLKEASKHGVLVNLTLKFTEDSMEWTMVEADGEETGRLVPE